MPGSKQKLSITSWDVKTKSATDNTFSAMLNPTGYSQSLKVKYTAKAIPGVAEPEVNYSCTAAETLEMEDLILDGTGVLNSSGIPATTDVKSQIALLKKVVYESPNNDKVERPVVQIIWGSLNFIGRVNNLVAKYTMFKPSGEPLRARVKLSFTEYKDADEKAQAGAATSAAALTRQVQISDSTNLPLMCASVYQNSSMYMDVAKFNDLTSVLGLVAGVSLLFPSLN